MKRKAETTAVTLDEALKKLENTEGYQELLDLISDLNGSVEVSTENGKGDYRLPYSSDPTPVEKPWQTDFSS